MIEKSKHQRVTKFFKLTFSQRFPWIYPHSKRGEKENQNTWAILKIDDWYLITFVGELFNLEDIYLFATVIWDIEYML